MNLYINVYDMNLIKIRIRTKAGIQVVLEKLQHICILRFSTFPLSFVIILDFILLFPTL